MFTCFRSKVTAWLCPVVCIWSPDPTLLQVTVYRNRKGISEHLVTALPFLEKSRVADVTLVAACDLGQCDLQSLHRQGTATFLILGALGLISACAVCNHVP